MPRTLPHQAAHGHDVDPHLGKGQLHLLINDQWLVVEPGLPGKAGGGFRRATGDAQGNGTHRPAGVVQDIAVQRPARAFGAHQVPRRHKHVVKEELRRVTGPLAELSLLASHLEPLLPALDDKTGIVDVDPGRVAILSLQDGKGGHVIAMAATGDKDLLAVEDVATIHPACCGGVAGPGCPLTLLHIRAGLWFGDGIGHQLHIPPQVGAIDGPLPAQDRGQVTGEQQRPHAQIVGQQRQPNAATGSAELLRLEGDGKDLAVQQRPVGHPAQWPGQQLRLEPPPARLCQNGTGIVRLRAAVGFECQRGE